MLIDWFTVAAQAVNFLILVWLLKRFLYRPVLAAIDARQQKIAAQLADAAQKETQARLEREDFQRRTEALERERAGLLRKATDDAAAERQRLFEAARHDAETLRAKLNEALATERDELARRLSSQIQAEVFALTRKALADLAGASMEERMIDVFLEHLHALPDTQRRLLTAETGTTRPAVLVRSAFELSLVRRSAIKAAIGECLGTGLAIRFELTPELICGIELTLGGVKLAWSVNDYLKSVSEKLLALLAPARTATTLPSREAAQHV